MKKILVAGGAGFLGSHLCKSLLADGHHVTCMDNLYTGRMINIDGLFGSNFEFKCVDIAEQPKLGWYDEVYNLACPASPPAYQKDPIKTFWTSIMGTKHCIHSGSKVFLASTSEVYGDPVVHPQPETYFGNVNTVGIRSCYDEGKRAAETIMMDFHRQYNISIKIARIFNTYGPNMSASDGRVVSNFIMQCLYGEPITIYGDGQQTRSFCYVDDLIRGFKLLMDSDSSLVTPVNLGNPGEFTMLELAVLVKELTGSKSEIVFKPLPSDDPTQRKPDISKAERLLGWKPTVELREGLMKSIEYFRRFV